MKGNFENSKLVVRFTLNFILHQILLFLAVSLPAIFYIVVLKETMVPVVINLTTGFILVAYILYCLFYGYYVARPMFDIISKIQKLSSGGYFKSDKKRCFNFASGRLYREVYANLESLSVTLQENECKRKEFEQLRQEWAAGVTHDLKTPLSYISGYTDMLLSSEYRWSEQEEREFLQLIKEKSTHLEELINDLGIAFRMDQSVGMKYASQKIELVELLRRVIAEIANMPSSKGNSFEILGEGPLYFNGDVHLLKRAFTNLIVNAIVHNPPGTEITVSIRKNPQLEVEIKDNGKGKDEETIKHLFDRYYRGTSTEAPTGGTGLGMAIVKQIITAHRGIIEVVSKVEKGTSILIKLPI